MGRMFVFQSSDHCGTVGHRGRSTLGLIAKAVQKLKAGWCLSRRQIGMGAEAQVCVGGAIRDCVSGQRDIGFHVPYGAKIGVPHRTDTSGELKQYVRIVGKVAKAHHPNRYKVIDPWREGIVVVQYIGSVMCGRLREVSCGPPTKCRQPAGRRVHTSGNMTQPSRMEDAWFVVGIEPHKNCASFVDGGGSNAGCAVVISRIDQSFSGR